MITTLYRVKVCYIVFSLAFLALFYLSQFSFRNLFHVLPPPPSSSYASLRSFPFRDLPSERTQKLISHIVPVLPSYYFSQSITDLLSLMIFCPFFFQTSFASCLRSPFNSHIHNTKLSYTHTHRPPKSLRKVSASRLLLAWYSRLYIYFFLNTKEEKTEHLLSSCLCLILSKSQLFHRLLENRLAHTCW